MPEQSTPSPIELMLAGGVDLVMAGKAGRGPGGLPKDCPVIPVGIDGNVYYYLDATRQLRALDAGRHNKLWLQSLFGHEIGKLYEYWPRLKYNQTEKKWDTTGWRPDEASEALMSAAAAAGIWNGLDRVRGSGAWADKGRLVVHCGDAVLIDGVAHAPGRIGEYVYPSGRKGPRPATGALLTPQPVRELLDLLESWNWKRGAMDARLLLGWMGAAWLGGALKWRPVAWISGGKGTGKSTLHDVIKHLFGGALVQVSDSSAAGIWQRLQYSVWPVAFDEAEPEQDNRNIQAVIKLARLAASGGLILRGSQDHQAIEFVARSCFLFSSILLPPLLGQDRSRMAILELGELAPGPMLNIDADRLAQTGNLMLRRLVDGWPRLQEVLAFYHEELARLGHSARGCDVFGTLLACADVMLSDDMPCTDDVEGWIGDFRASGQGEWADDEPDESRCLSHLLTSPIEPYRGGVKHVMAEWVVKAAPVGEGSEDEDALEANRVLGTYGLKVVAPRMLAVANYHQQLGGIYRGTHWAGRSGSQGVWVQALRRVPGALAAPKPIWFSGAVARATLLPLAGILPSYAEVVAAEGQYRDR